MFYYVNLECIKSIQLTPVVTKTPETRIFPIDSEMFEIHFCTIQQKLTSYEIYLHFPGQKTEFLTNPTPVSTFALCIETDRHFCKEFKPDSSFRLLRKDNFVLPNHIKISFDNLFEMNFLFSSIQEKLKHGIHDIESVKYIVRKINHASWKLLSFGNYSFLYVLNALDYIDKHHKEKMTIQTIADRCLLTPNYLSRLFQEITGRTVKEIIDIARASSAREDLFYSNKTLPKLAVENGFSTRTSMTKIFQFLFEMSPEECKKFDRDTRLTPLPYEHCMMDLLFRN